MGEKRRRTRRPRDREKTRAEILQATWDLFVSRGPQATTNRMIAQRVGVNASLIYHYFPSKAALMQAMFEAMVEPVIDQLAQLIDAERVAGHEGVRLLEGLMRGYFHHLAANPDLHQAMMQWSANRGALPGPAPWSDASLRLWETLTHTLTEGQRRGLFRADLPADAMVIAALGLIEYWFVIEKDMPGGQGEEDRAARRALMLDTFVAIILRGVTP